MFQIITNTIWIFVRQIAFVLGIEMIKAKGLD